MNLLTATLHRAFSTISKGRHPEHIEGPPHPGQQPRHRLRSIFARLPLWLALVLGTSALAVAAFFWLEIPDSHTWQLILSLLVAGAILLGFLCLYATTIRRIRFAAESTPLWLALLLLAVWLLITWLLVHLVVHIEPGIADRAGFLNSRLSPHLRTTFTYARLITWQHDLELILTWVIVPALLLPFAIETVARGFRTDVWRNATRVLRRWRHWLAVIVLGHLGLWLTGGLAKWRPSHSVSGELISVTLRVGLIYIVDLLLLLLMLAFDSELLARAVTTDHASRNPAP